MVSLKKALAERELKVEIEVPRDQQGNCSPELFAKTAWIAACRYRSVTSGPRSQRCHPSLATRPFDVFCGVAQDLGTGPLAAPVRIESGGCALSADAPRLQCRGVGSHPPSACVRRG